MRLIAPLALNGTRIGYATGPWALPALSLPAATDDPLFPEVQAWAAWAVLLSGDTELGLRLAREAAQTAVSAALDDSSLCRLLRSAVGVLSATVHNDEVGQLAGRWEEAARASADDYELAQALVMVGMPSAFAGDLRAALVHLDEAVGIARRLGNPTAITYTTMTAGWLRSESEPERAMELLDEALGHATSVGNNLGIGMVLGTLAQLHEIRGSWEEAAHLMVRGAEHFHRIGDASQFWNLLHPAMVVMATANADEAAAVLYGATPTGKGLHAGGDLGSNPWVSRFNQSVDKVRTRLGEDHFLACAARGSRMDELELVDFVRDEVGRLLSAADQVSA